MEMAIPAAAVTTVASVFITDRHYCVHGRPGIFGPVVFAGGVLATSLLVRRGASNPLRSAKLWTASSLVSGSVGTWMQHSFPSMNSHCPGRSNFSAKPVWVKPANSSER